MAIFTGIASAVSGLMASTFLSGAVGSFLLKTAVGVGLNLLAQAITGKPERPTFSINGSLQGGGDLPRSFIFGRTITAGSLVWSNTWGRHEDTPNANLTQVISLSDLPVKGLGDIFVNGERCTIDWSTTDQYRRGHPIKQYRKDGQDNLWIHFYDGTQTEPDYLLTTWASNTNRSWGANRIGRGVAYVVITSLVAKQMFSGIPNFKFDVDGVRLYDPSKDSTNGGSGAHRYSDRTTWGGDGDYNPAVQVYNLLRGIYYGNEWIYGVQGMSAVRLPSVNWIAAINKCRQQIASAEGFVPQYRSSGEITVDAPLSVALEAVNSTCLGRISEIGGTYQMFVGAPDAPVIAFHDDDIISSAGQSFTPFSGLADTINGISTTYPSLAEGGAVKTAPPLYRTDLEALHGNRRLMSSIEMTFSPYPEQVQRLMKAALEEGQRARRHTITLPPRFWAYAVPGVVFSWTSPRNGYVNKLMRVDGVIDNDNLDVMVDLTEVDPSDYDWNSSIDFDPPIDGAIGAMRPQPQPIIDFSALPAVAKDADGNDRRPAILLGWDGNKTAVDLVRFEVRQAWDLVTCYAGRTEDVGRGSILIAPFDLINNEQYQVRARYAVYDDSRDFLWSDWIAVHLPDVRLGPLDRYPIDINDFHEGLQKFYADQAADIRHIHMEVDRLTTALNENIADGSMQRLELQTSVVAQINKNKAEYTNLITVQAGETDALSRRVETVTATVDGNRSEYTSLISAQANATSALSGRVDTLTTVVDSNKSEYLSLIAAESDERQSQVTRIDQLVAQNATDIATVDQFSQTNVSRLDDEVYAISQSVISTQAQVGLVSANGFFQVKSEANQAGSSSRVSFNVSTTAGIITNAAAAFLEALSDGTSRFVVDADTMIVAGSGERKRPFVIQNGKLYADQLYVDWAKIENAVIGWANIENAVTNNFVATNANIGTAVIGTSNLDFNQVTQSYERFDTFPVAPAMPNDWVTICEMATYNPQANTAFAEVRTFVPASVATTSGGASGSHTVRVLNATTGVVFAERTASSTGNLDVSIESLYIDVSAALGTNIYRIQRRGVNARPNGGSGVLRSLVWKR